MRGFTLIELLIVLLLASLLMMLIPPLFSSSLNSLSLKSEADDLATSLRRARNSSIAMSKKVIWRLDLERKEYSVAGKDQTTKIPADIDLMMTAADLGGKESNKGEIIFFSDGGSSGGIVTMGIAERKQTITVDWLTGRIFIE